jgi:hypothetical protein
MSPSVSAGGELKTLELRELVRLARITVDLNRMMSAQRKRAEQPCERAGQSRANHPASQPKSHGLSKEVSQTMPEALLAGHPIAPAKTAAPPPPETTADPTKSVPDIAEPAKAQRGTSERKQPLLTAPDRIYPHLKNRPAFAIYHHPLSLALSCHPEADFPLTSGPR